MNFGKRQRRNFVIAAVCVAAIGCQTVFESSDSPTPGAVNVPQQPEREAYFADNIQPFFEEHCFRCHGEKKQEAGLNIEALAAFGRIGLSEGKWERILMMVESGQMPPPDRRRPHEDDVADVADFIEEQLETVWAATTPDPGRVTARRLNRQEYNNTVRDLLGVDSEPADDFPVDNSGYGFDNIGDVLSLSPLHLEKYMAAAEEIAEEAVRAELEKLPELPYENRLIFICRHDGDDHTRKCARAVVRHLASRAYRRPVDRRDVNRLTDLVRLVQQEGDSFERGVQLAIEALLVSPRFLFRIEQDRRPEDPETMRYVNDFELASRLSYFLWSSMPDEELFDAAYAGRLREPEALEAQVRRMIQDEKAWAFVDNFAGQWLQLRNMSIVRIDRDKFPEFDSDMRRHMRKETELYFDAVIREDRSVLEFVDSDYTYLNEPLAEHYGIEGVEGDEFRRVEVASAQRGGVLTHGSILTLTSYPRRTSPVVRGAWILENILGTPPPPPPDDVPDLDEEQAELTGGLREQLEQHRSNESCASCHSRIDPLGFGFENYDPIGRWREKEGEDTVDASGILPSGRKFNGSKELREILLEDPDDFVRCLAEKMLTYAIGRGVERFDRPAVAEIERRVRDGGYRFSSLLMAIVESPPFRMRRGEGVRE